MAKVTFTNKDKTGTDGIVNKWRDVDANELKTSINALYDATTGTGTGWATSGSTSITTPTITGDWTLNGVHTVADGGASARSILTITTCQTAPATPANYYLSLEQGTIDGGGSRDSVMSWGYNYLGAGRVNASEGALRFGIESQYNGDNEVHIEAHTASGGINRLLSFNSHKTTGVASGFITTNGFDFRASNTGVSYFSIASTSTSLNSPTGVASNILSGSSKTITTSFTAASNMLQLEYTTNSTDDTGNYIITGFNADGTFKGSNTNFYRFYIDNIKASTATAAGISFKLQSVEKGYIYASGSTRSVGANMVLASTTGGILLMPSNGYAITMSSSGLSRFGTSGTTPTKGWVELDAGSTTIAPLVFTSGTNNTTAQAGAMEYNGTNLFFTRTGTTRENVLVAVDNAAAPTTVAAGTVTNRYGGATNFLGDPNRWASVNILGVVYKIPLYT